MPNTPILTDSAAITRLAEELHRQPAIAVDLEADSMHCYRDKVCLLQFSTAGRTVLVDPLAVADLEPLKAVLADPQVRKIFHAADYDIRCLHRDFGIEIRGLFDTMVSCQFLGEEKVGLADVLGKHFGVELDKRYQRADWSVRPLTPEMISYAAEDTRHLHRLVALLEGRLEEKGRLAWVAEEFALLEQVRHSEAEGPLFLRAKGAGTLDRRQLAVLEELLQWRDREAQRRDCPLFRVVGNKSLLDLARNTPRSHQGLVAIEGISPRLADRYGKQMLQAIERGLNLPQDQLPVYPRSPRPERDPEADRRLALLKEMRTAKAGALGMDPGILINNTLLELISRNPPRKTADLEGFDGMKNWQREVLGEEIVKTLGKE
ncbi:ribonuclease D [Desulfuromonas versatilis]|uniref:Ribonuclease D n=1 Tax=Desulfuromonas versatilis TaxID=2802975 RepID=A0ABN6DSE1_9BACT|nr:ribonuclease D [Desulfuromonas versatilis]BCR03105.1 ribonuclease D [Desulfuromonas versatilis]